MKIVGFALVLLALAQVAKTADFDATGVSAVSSTATVTVIR